MNKYINESYLVSDGFNVLSNTHIYKVIRRRIQQKKKQCIK